jgi:DNA-binding transcriptional LysR family regulator
MDSILPGFHDHKNISRELSMITKVNDEISSMLDVAEVKAFVLVADLLNFTRAAEALGTSQASVSARIKRLEAALGRRLLERSPRLVRLSTDGALFINAARSLLRAHQDALDAFMVEKHVIVVAISHHVVGGDLPELLERLAASDPALVIEVRIVASRDALDALANGSVDAAIVLDHDSRRRGGEVLFTEEFGWMASPRFDHQVGRRLRLATQAEPCSVRDMAIRALGKRRIPWAEVFVGGGVATIGAALSAGLAVGVLARRVAPPGTVDVGRRFGLPPLPTRRVMLCAAPANARARQAMKVLAAAFRTLASR